MDVANLSVFDPPPVPQAEPVFESVPLVSNCAHPVAPPRAAMVGIPLVLMVNAETDEVAAPVDVANANPPL